MKTHESKRRKKPEHFPNNYCILVSAIVLIFEKKVKKNSPSNIFVCHLHTGVLLVSIAVKEPGHGLLNRTPLVTGHGAVVPVIAHARGPPPVTIVVGESGHNHLGAVTAAKEPAVKSSMDLTSLDESKLIISRTNLQECFIN